MEVKEAPKMGYYLKAGSLGNGESPRYFLLGSVVGFMPEIIYENKPQYGWLQAPQIEEKEEYIMNKNDKILWSAFKQSVKEHGIKFHERIKINVEEDSDDEYNALLYGAKTHFLYGVIHAYPYANNYRADITIHKKIKGKVYFGETPTQDMIEKTTHEKLERRILNSYPYK